MNKEACVIGYKLLSPTVRCRAIDRKSDDDWRQLLKEFGLSRAKHFESIEKAKLSLEGLGLSVVITFNDEEARQIKSLKPETFIYVVSHPRSIFFRKAEFQKKNAEIKGTFKEIRKLVKKIRIAEPKEREMIGSIAALTFDDLYKMIKDGLVSDDERMVRSAWNMLHQDRSDMVWMKAKLVTEVWENGDAQVLEKMLIMAMDQHVDNGFAVESDKFIDKSGVQYRQYNFQLPNGQDLKYVRRIPSAGKMRRDQYLSLLEENDIPNGPAMLLEAGHVRNFMQNSYCK